MFDDVLRTFIILPNENSKSGSSKSFKRPQKSTTESIKNRPIFEETRKALGHVAEEVGGTLTCQSSGFLPRNAAQSYYLKDKITVAIIIKKQGVISSSDPHTSLILKCKEQAKSLNLLLCGNWSVHQKRPYKQLEKLFVLWK